MTETIETPDTPPVETQPSPDLETSRLDPLLEAFIARWEDNRPRRVLMAFLLARFEGEIGDRVQKDMDSILSGLAVKDIERLEQTVKDEAQRLVEAARLKAKEEAEAAKKQAEEDAKKKAPVPISAGKKRRKR